MEARTTLSLLSLNRAPSAPAMHAARGRRLNQILLQSRAPSASLGAFRARKKRKMAKLDQTIEELKLQRDFYRNMASETRPGLLSMTHGPNGGPGAPPQIEAYANPSSEQTSKSQRTSTKDGYSNAGQFPPLTTHTPVLHPTNPHPPLATTRHIQHLPTTLPCIPTIRTRSPHLLVPAPTRTAEPNNQRLGDKFVYFRQGRRVDLVT